MTTPITDDAIAAAEACIHAATPAEDTGHSQACDCPDCGAAWAHGALLVTARHWLAATHAPALLAEVRQLRGLSDSEGIDAGDRVSSRELWRLLATVTAERDAAIASGERLRRGVVANAGRLSREVRPRWAHVMDATGLGSTSAAALCAAAGFDPAEHVGLPETK